MVKLREKMRMALVVAVIPAAAGSFLSITCSEDTVPPSTGNPDADAGPGELDSLTIEPQDVTLVVVNGEVQLQEFTVTGEYEDGEPVDLTGQAVFEISNGALGDFDGNLLTTSDNAGGQAVVSAKVGETVAEAQVTVVIESTFIADGLPDGVDSSRDIYVRVRYASAATCDQWHLIIQGDTNVSTNTCSQK